MGSSGNLYIPPTLEPPAYTLPAGNVSSRRHPFSQLLCFRRRAQICKETGIGKRDYALLLLLARLGLRAGEVVALALDDFDWEAGLVTVRGKGKRVAQMPLPSEVGAAIADYLSTGRPQCSSRRVFIRGKAPLTGFANSVAICSLVDRALERAGVESEYRGSHVFRHSLATGMLNRWCILG